MAEKYSISAVPMAQLDYGTPCFTATNITRGVGRKACCKLGLLSNGDYLHLETLGPVGGDKYKGMIITSFGTNAFML